MGVLLVRKGENERWGITSLVCCDVLKAQELAGTHCVGVVMPLILRQVVWTLRIFHAGERASTGVFWEEWV